MVKLGPILTKDNLVYDLIVDPMHRTGWCLRITVQYRCKIRHKITNAEMKFCQFFFSARSDNRSGPTLLSHG